MESEVFSATTPFSVASPEILLDPGHLLMTSQRREYGSTKAPWGIAASDPLRFPLE